MQKAQTVESDESLNKAVKEMLETKKKMKKMKAQTVEFDIDKKNLLKDVISKQTGSLNKAIKELFQNSFDAGATEIKVDINVKGLRFRDNGAGMDQEEIRKYFTVFGATNKRDDNSKTGNFGMGRGQIFNFGRVLWKTQNSAMVVDIKKDLEYKLLKTNKVVNGTDIIISFYKKARSWDISDHIYTIKRDVLPPREVAIYIDGKRYNPQISQFKDFSTRDYFVFTSSHHNSKIYNGNLAVIYIKNSNYDYCVMPYDKLTLNFARNELIQNVESTTKLMDFIYDIEEKMASTKKIFDLGEAKNVLKMLSEKRFTISSVYSKRVIPMANGQLISFKELIEEPNVGILFGKKNIWSDDCLRNDYKVISNDIKNLFIRIKDLYTLKVDIMDKDTKELSRKGYHRELELSKLTRNKMFFWVAVELNDYIFTKLMITQGEDLRIIHLGFSDLATAWTKPWDDKIFLNKTFIQSLQTKEEGIIRIWETLCHEYAHTTENTSEDYHNHSFYSQYEENISSSTKLLAQTLKFITRKYIKEKYDY